MFSFVNAGTPNLPPVKQGECATLRQTCGSCSYINISVSYPNSTLAVDNQEMTSLGGGLYTYEFCDTNDLGRYDYPTCGDIEGEHTCNSEAPYFEVKNSNSFIFFILIGLAILFFIATLFVNEEFFVYISGVLWILSGIYLMINGIDIISDWYSRGVAYVCIGIGFLFTIGAYVYNSYNKWRDNEEY